MKLNIVLNNIEKKLECANYQRPLKVNCKSCLIFNEPKEKKKIKCKNCQSEYIEDLQDIPVQQNGFILCGPYLNGKCLTVIDFDNKNHVDYSVTDVKRILNINNTLIVRTGSKGYHFYFWITIDEYLITSCSRPIDALTTEIKKIGVTGIDIRGLNGIVFAPGCKFKEHTYNPYIIIDNSEILELDAIEFGDILKRILIQNFFDNIYIKKNDGNQNSIEAPKTVTVDVKTAVKKMRHGFKDIWTGKFIIEHIEQKSSGKSELNYWTAFWREYIACGGNVEDALQYFSMALTQPEYDEGKTRTGLRYIKFINLRPTMDEYVELFPQYETEQKLIRLNYNMQEMKKNQDKVITALKMMGVWKDDKQ